MTKLATHKKGGGRENRYIFCCRLDPPDCERERIEQKRGKGERDMKILTVFPGLSGTAWGMLGEKMIQRAHWTPGCTKEIISDSVSSRFS